MLLTTTATSASVERANSALRHVKTDFRIEAATRGVLCKKVFLEIWQNSQENTSVRVSFLIKLQA